MKIGVLALHGAVIALLFLAAGPRAAPPQLARAFASATRLIEPYISAARIVHHGGGGGGSRDVTPASFGRLAKPAPRQFTPPAAVTYNADPKLTMEPSLVVPPDIALPQVNAAQYGLPTGVPGPPSNGRGSGGGIGDGTGGGAGDGDGPGYGPDKGGGVTTAESRSGPTTPPAVLWMREPEYTDEARRAKVQGTVVLYLEVDGGGKARNLRVIQGLGLGLDERAVEAVLSWKFRPGYRNGRAVLTSARVEVNFRLL